MAKNVAGLLSLASGGPSIGSSPALSSLASSASLVVTLTRMQCLGKTSLCSLYLPGWTGCLDKEGVLHSEIAP